MALREVGAVVHHVLGSWFGLSEKNDIDIVKIVRYGVIVLVLTGAGIGGFFIYRWNATHQEKIAQQQFAHYYKEFMVSERSKEGWEQVATLFGNGAQTYARTSLAPYFYAYQAEALQRDGKHQEAIAVMDRMMDAISSDSVFANLFKIKRALMMLDAQNEAMQQKGLSTLIELARDKKEAYSDTALFYLGRYYWATDKIEQAQEIWQDLAVSQQQEKLAPSPWVALVEPYLQQMAS